MTGNSFLLHGNMSEHRVMEEMKRHAVIVPLDEENSNLETAAFLKLGRQFVFKVKSELKPSRFDVATISYKK